MKKNITCDTRGGKPVSHENSQLFKLGYCGPKCIHQHIKTHDKMNGVTFTAAGDCYWSAGYRLSCLDLMQQCESVTG